MKNEIANTESAGHWHELKASLPQVLSLTKGITLLIIIDICISLLIPYVMPERLLFKYYLNENVKEVTEAFLNGKTYLIPDPDTGWINRPLARSGNWIIDKFGSRSSHPMTKKKQKNIRITFLGSSVINGGMGVKNTETISSFIENEDIEAFNFGTMMHSVDQSLIAYNSQIYQYESDYLVVGLHNEVDALSSMYLPFRRRDETNMPYIKPIFQFSSNQPKPNKVAPKIMLAEVPDDQNFIEYLKLNDPTFYRFNEYKNFGLMPISSSLYWVYEKVRNNFLVDKNFLKGLSKQEAIIQMIVAEATKHNSQVIFVKFSGLSELQKSKYLRLFRDDEKMHNEMLQNAGIDVLYANQILAATGKPIEQFYAADGIHLTAEANKILAHAICMKIENNINRRDKQVRCAS